MKKTSILKKNYDFERVINSKKRISNKYYSLFYTSSNINKYGISVPKKIGIAVIRNKIKRQIKNIVDNNEKILPKPYEYVIIVKREILELKYQEMEKELLKLIANIKGE